MSRAMDQGRGTYVLGPVRFCHASTFLFLTTWYPCGRGWVWLWAQFEIQQPKPKPHSPIFYSVETRRSHDQAQKGAAITEVTGIAQRDRSFQSS